METVLQTRKGGRGYRPTDRTKGTAIAKASGRTAPDARPAFLAQVFQPIVCSSHSELKNGKKLSECFYSSVDNICRCYGIQAERYLDLPYPINLARCLYSLKRQMAVVDKSLEIRLLQDEVSLARLATVHTFSNGNTLFYFPTEVVFYLLETDLQTAELLLSVYSYLFRYIGIPHYSEDYSYIGGIYEMIEEMYSCEDDPDRDKDYYEYLTSHLQMIQEKGAKCVMLFREKIHVMEFAERVANYQPSDKKQMDFHETAKAFLKLSQDFPKRNIHDRISPPLTDDYDGLIRLEQYLHFHWSNNCPVIDELMDYVNAELNECAEMEEPTTFQYFDTPQVSTTHEHDFEKRLCDLLHDLSDNVTDLRR